jgi:hypothetical protein
MIVAEDEDVSLYSGPLCSLSKSAKDFGDNAQPLASQHRMTTTEYTPFFDAGMTKV